MERFFPNGGKAVKVVEVLAHCFARARGRDKWSP